MTARETVAGKRTGGLHATYDAALAAAWHKWFHIIEDGAQALSDHMVERAAIAPGQRVLDVGTGLGEPAIAAARRVGPSGRVDAIDVSADMLTFAARRAADLGLDNVHFRHMDACALDMPEGAFDAVLCRWGLMFMSELDAVLARFRSCLVPGGRLVAAVWGPPEKVPGLSLGARVVLESLGMPPPEEGANTPFALADVAALARRLEAAGFAEVRGEWVTVEFAFESGAEYAAFRKDRSGPLNARIADHPEERRAAAWRAVGEAAQRFATPDGGVRMANEAYCIAARR